MANIKIKDLSYSEFVNLLKDVKEAVSVQGVRYSNIHISGNEMYGIRETTKKSFSFDVEDLYKAYCNEDEINTTILKDYINRVQSPAFAILLKAGIVA